MELDGLPAGFSAISLFMEKEQLAGVYVSNGSYSFFKGCFCFCFFAIPVTAFFLGNGWLCFGLLFFIVSS